MKKWKLLVVDVDGTLVGSSGVPTPRVKAAVADAEASGVRVALCSGRPLASCWPIARSLGLRGAHVVFNGALVQDPDQPAPVLSRPLPKGPARRVVEFCREHDLCCELYTAETHYVERDWRESQLHAVSIRVGYDVLPDGGFDALMEHHEIVKIQIITSDERTQRLTAGLAAEMVGDLSMSVAIPMAPADGLQCVNVVDRSVSKGLAVRALIAHLGLSREQVLAAGDAPNDLPVFDEVGYRIAMANGEESVRAAADYIALGVEEDGLAVAIERLILG